MSIRINDLTVRFKNGVVAVNKASLEIPKGIYGLLGENGAGKTTLMRVLTTVLKQTEGMVSLDGILYNEGNYEKIQKKIGYLPQEIDLYPNLTVKECLVYMGGLSGVARNDLEQRITYYLEKTSLTEHQNKKMRQLSGGMKRRVGLIQALLNNPDFLIIDEPTTGLDPEERIRIRNLLVDFSKDRTVLFSTHVVEDLAATCTQLANRAFHPEDSIIDVSGVQIGGDHLGLIAGPCSVESFEQVLEIAQKAKASGANLLRGGAFKPRTSPYSFQGLGLEGLDILCAVKEEVGLPIVTELMSPKYLDVFNEKVDLIQIGARNMQNFDLLKELGQLDRPILLKRGLNATYEEWIMSAEYIMASGNENVILCERGIRTFETYTRNTLDLQCIPVLRKKTHLPIIVDPSHAGGKWWLVEPMAKAAIAAGADGLMIEVHNNPEAALCDGAQSLKPEKYDALLKQVSQIATVIGKSL